MIEIDRTLNAPLAQVWRLLIDTRRWPDWGPSITAVDVPRPMLELGLKGRVRTVVGLWLPFEITGFEPERSWRWRVAGVPATGHRVERVDAQHTRLVFEIPVVAAPYAPVCALACRRIARLCG